MTTPSHRYQNDHIRRYISVGEAHRRNARGWARAILMILLARGVDVPREIRAEIGLCIDLDRLEAWTRQAVTADRIEDLDLRIEDLD